MLGWVRWTDRRRARVESVELLGLPVVLLELPERDRERPRRVSRGARLLSRQPVTRVLTPEGFSGWPQLLERGLRPVDTRALRCALAPDWVRESLRGLGVPPERAVLALTGERVSLPMEQVARTLCPMVRNLILDAPGGGVLAARLGREFGLPVLPPHCAQADLTLHFDPAPVLTNARFSLAVAALPQDCEPLPLLTVLWENGSIQTKQVKINNLSLDSIEKNSYNTTHIIRQ